MTRRMNSLVEFVLTILIGLAITTVIYGIAVLLDPQTRSWIGVLVLVTGIGGGLILIRAYWFNRRSSSREGPASDGPVE